MKQMCYVARFPIIVLCQRPEPWHYLVVHLEPIAGCTLEYMASIDFAFVCRKFLSVCRDLGGIVPRRIAAFQPGCGVSWFWR
jgi:hypothetical protein